MSAFTYTGPRFVAWLIAKGYDPSRLTPPEAWALSMMYDKEQAAFQGEDPQADREKV